MGHHLNHISFFSAIGGTMPTRPKPTADEEADKILGQASAAPMQKLVPWSDANTGVLWRFLPKSAYRWTRSEGVQGALLETLSQQLLRLEAYAPGNEESADKTYLKWDWTGRTFSPAATSHSSWRLDTNTGKSFGQDTPVFFQQASAGFPSLFHPSEKSTSDYKQALDSVNGSWTSTEHTNFITYRPS